MQYAKSLTIPSRLTPDCQRVAGSIFSKIIIHIKISKPDTYAYLFFNSLLSTFPQYLNSLLNNKKTSFLIKQGFSYLWFGAISCLILIRQTQDTSLKKVKFRGYFFSFSCIDIKDLNL
jgi:hypothetical protein